MTTKIVKPSNVDLNTKIILESKIWSSSFHVAMRFPLQLSQCFGLFPMDVGGLIYESLKIKWFHWRMLYCVLSFGLAAFTLFAQLWQLIQNMHQSLGIIFSIDCVIKYILFFKLTLDWPSYVKEWHVIENNMKKYELCSHLQTNLKYITLVMICLATVEHFLINGFLLLDCLDSERTVSEALKKYFVQVNYSATFGWVEYSLLVGIIFEFTNLQMTFVWNYGDIFIMLIATALQSKLNQITKRLKSLCKLKVRDVQVWNTVRNDYLQLAKLCHSTNKKISLLIIVSFSSNLYFVLKQLFSSLRPMESTLEKLYFFVSFGLLLLRVTCVCIFGSNVHVEWENISYALQSVQSAAYNIEVHRFVENVSTCELVLTGKNFFRITRGLVLKIAGAIVTYELVVIQFNMDTLKSKLY